MREFLGTETEGATVLLGATLAALAWANIDSASYERLWTTVLSIRLGDGGVVLDLRHWVNSGLMTLFLFVIGLEARREFGLRYFTVYGPRQRPDMAIRRLCEAAVEGGRFVVYGDGSQIRDFTFVADVVDATVRAVDADLPPPILNIGGGEPATLLEVIRIIEEVAGTTITLDRRPDQGDDVRRTGADTSLARASLGWRPTVALRDGLAATVEWIDAAVAVA